MTIQQKAALRDQENIIRESLERITHCKQLGIHQKSIDKMISWAVRSKADYNNMKRRFEANDE